MPKDLTIRLLGRPQVTEDDQVGYHRISRQYVIEGYRSEYSEVNHPQNPLFLPVGTEDEEYTSHYLVNQKISPAQGSMDKAYLVREYAEIRDTYVQESVTVTNDLRRLRRTYVVLRNSDGYGSNWSKHPQQTTGYEPWDYAPPVITSPSSVSYSNSNFTVNNKTTPLYTTFKNESTYNSGVWLKGSAQVSMSQPGVDVWSVEWVTHNNAYLTSSLKRGAKGSFKLPSIVELDQNGLKISDFGGSSSSSSSSIGQVASHVGFFVGEEIPANVTAYWGGAANYQPSVMLDFYLEGYEHRNGLNISRLLRNTVYINDGAADIYFDDAEGTQRRVARQTAHEIIFEGDFTSDLSLDANTSVTKSTTGGFTITETNSVTITETNKDLLPHFKKKPIGHAGGRISFTTSFSPSAQYASLIGVSVTPVFASADKSEDVKIWRVVTTYAG